MSAQSIVESRGQDAGDFSKLFLRERSSGAFNVRDLPTDAPRSVLGIFARAAVALPRPAKHVD